MHTDKIVTRQMLERLATMRPEEPKKQRKSNGSYKPFDLESWISKHGLSVRRTKPWQGGTVHMLTECPFNPEHNHGEVCIIQLGNGALQFKCFHNSCTDKDWHALRDKLEPGWRERRKDGNGVDEDAGCETDDFSEEEETSKRQSQSDRILGLVEKLPITFFHDEFAEPYARIKVAGHYEVWRVRSKQFKRWLSQQFWQTERKVPNSDALNAALNVIEAKACYQGKQYKLNTRVAWHEGAIWYDLGDWRAVRIGAKEWHIVNAPPILFRRFPHQKVQADPLPGCGQEGLDEMFHFINLEEDEKKRDLLRTYVVTGAIPDIPHPILVVYGTHGAAKTFSYRVIKWILDPSILKTLTHTKEVRELIQLASHHWCIFLDNLSYLPDWLSDAFCRISTGDGFSKRELYTDDEDIIYAFQRCGGMNGINLVATKPDLLDRSILFQLERIPEDRRKPEKELWREFDEVKPRILGGLFDVLSKAIAAYEEVKLYRVPRMADYALWACAVMKALGKNENDFLRAYDANVNAQNQEALDASPIGQAIISFMSRKEKWDGSPSELLEELRKIAEELKLDTRDRKFPKDPRWLWRRIKEITTNLLGVGILAERNDTNHEKGKIINLTRISHRDGETDDKTAEKENDVRDDVRRKRAKTLDGGQHDDTDDIYDTLSRDDATHRECCDCTQCCPDPWD